MLSTDSSASAGQSSSQLARGLKVLDLLAETPQTPSQLAAELSVNRSTSLRLLNELEALGYVSRSGSDGTYHCVVERLLPLIRGGRSEDWRSRAQELLHVLSRESGEACLVGVPAVPWMSYVEYVPSQHAITVSERIGSIRPVHASAVGKAWLSTLADSDLASTVANLRYDIGTERAAQTPEELTRDVLQIRERGWALDNEEYLVGVTCIAVPLVVGGWCPGSVAISGPSTRLQGAAIQDLAHLLVTRLIPEVNA